MKFANVVRDNRVLQAPLEHDQLTAVCRHALGPAAQLTAAERVTSGGFNTTYRLRFAEDVPLILRIAPPPDALLFRHEMMLLQRECAVQPLLAKASALVPRVVFRDFSYSLLPRAYVLQNCLEGQLWDELAAELDELESASLWHQLGSHVRRIHDIRGHHFGFPVPMAEYARYSDWLQSCALCMVQDLTDLGIQVDGLERFLELLQRGRLAIDCAGPPRLVHGDLWPRNILVTRQDGQPVISGILDAERAFWGEPLAEWIFSFLDIPDAFWRSYGIDLRATMLDSPELFRRRCYEARGSLQLILEAYRYGFDAAFARRNFQIGLTEMERLLGGTSFAARRACKLYGTASKRSKTKAGSFGEALSCPTP